MGDNANTFLPERSNDHEEPALVRPPDAGAGFFAVHDPGLNIKRVVLDDLFGLLGET